MSAQQQKQFEKIFEDLPVQTYWKAIDGKYSQVNQNFLTGYNMNSELDILGLKDSDIWNGNAPSFDINDRKVIFYEKKNIFIEENFFENEKRFYLSCKNPWYSSDGKLLGIYGASFLLNSKEPLTSSKYCDALTMLLDRFQFFYNKKDSTNLSSQQKETLCYLVQGMTIKQIAIAMSLAPRTVEHYLETVKVKLNCCSRYELIKKAFQLGLI